MAAALAGNLVMPPACLHCGDRRWKGTPLCLGCLRKVERLGPGTCARCGSPDCRDGHDYWPHPYEGARFLYRMGPELSAVVHGFKYRHMARNARFLAAGLRRREDLLAWMRSHDVLVPVPLHAVRRRERGFNQSDLIARAFSELSGVRVEADLLRRVRSTGTQTKLGKEGRLQNLEAAFDCPDASRLAGRRILLVDDVFTTGSTASACASALRRAGSGGVGVMALGLVERREVADDFVREMEAVAAYMA
jgi:ComF family protein